MTGLAIKEVAERTGLTPGTIRAWEQRYGFPEPRRSSSGYRLYSREDVATLERVVAFRRRGLSIPASLERARSFATGVTDRPSLFGALAGSDAASARPQLLSKRTMLAISKAIEDEALARAAAPIVVAAFQEQANFRAVEHRYRRLARSADAVLVFADFDAVREDDDGLVELPIPPHAALGSEWAVVIDAPGYAACLIGWETPESERDRDQPESERCFEAVWTLDARIVRDSAQVAVRLAAPVAPEIAARLDALLAERPLAIESPAPGLTALTNRIVGYLE